MSQDDILKFLENNSKNEYTVKDLSFVFGISICAVGDNLRSLYKQGFIKFRKERKETNHKYGNHFVIYKLWSVK